jgi:hypothetical protein
LYRQQQEDTKKAVAAATAARLRSIVTELAFTMQTTEAVLKNNNQADFFIPPPECGEEIDFSSFSFSQQEMTCLGPGLTTAVVGAYANMNLFHAKMGHAYRDNINARARATATVVVTTNDAQLSRKPWDQFIEHWNSVLGPQLDTLMDNLEKVTAGENVEPPTVPKATSSVSSDPSARP